MDSTTGWKLKKSFIKNQACFARLSDDEAEKLAELLTEKKVAAGETIVTEGDIIDNVYLIVSGSADVRHITIQNDAEHIESTATLGAGESIGLSKTGFYSLSGRRTATVVANTDMELLSLSVAAFHGFALAYPHVGDIMHQNVESTENN